MFLSEIGKGGAHGRLPPCLFHHSLLWFYSQPKSTHRPIDTQHSCVQVQSKCEQSTIKQCRDDRLLTVSDGWRSQWAADNVFPLWRQFAGGVTMVRVDSSVLCQNIPSGWMDVSMCPSSATFMQREEWFLHYPCFSFLGNDCAESF